MIMLLIQSEWAKKDDTLKFIRASAANMPHLQFRHRATATFS